MIGGKLHESRETHKRTRMGAVTNRKHAKALNRVIDFEVL